MKKNFIKTMLFIIGYVFVGDSLAQDPNHTFTYQGELLDGGTPANGNYDITISGFFGATGGSPQGMVSTHLNVIVDNGLFHLNNVNLVDTVSPFDGFELWLEVAVRQAGNGVYTALAPRQQLHAVPYAAKLTNGDATVGQVYTFDGDEWEPADSQNNSPWSINGSEISYVSGNVGIGVSTLGTLFPPARLEIATPSNVPVQFQGGDRMYNTYYENGEYRGYVGSFQAANAADFEIGTGGGNTTGRMHITTQGVPRISVSADGVTSILGDAKQNLDTNGVMKYMVETFCSLSPSLTKSYNGVVGNSGAISVMGGLLTGECIIEFPDNISNRYWQVSAISNSNRQASCIPGGTNQLICRTYVANTGNAVNGNIMLLVY